MLVDFIFTVLYLYSLTVHNYPILLALMLGPSADWWPNHWQLVSARKREHTDTEEDNRNESIAIAGMGRHLNEKSHNMK